MDKSILGLDLATSFGWAVVDGAGAYVASGHGRLATHDSLGKRAYDLRQRLADLVTDYSPDWLAIEKPIHNGKFTSIAVARALYSYATAAEEVAYLRELGYMEFARSTCCKEILLDGRAKKPAGVAFAQTLKPGITSHDEADAVLVALTCHRFRSGAAA